jgi:predicted SnoaL-like aldol condensation-catalyzing enzyme
MRVASQFPTRRLGKKTFYLIQGAAVFGLLSRPVLESRTGRDEIKNPAYPRRTEKEKTMSSTAEAGDALNPKTQMTHAEMKRFVQDHFEEFINRKNLDIADVNFATEFVEHGTDLPPGCPPGRAGTKQYVAGSFKKFPDLHVEILDMIAEDDRVVVHNHWTGTEAASGVKYELSGIVIWRIAHRKFVERWAYLSSPRPAG